MSRSIDNRIVSLEFDNKQFQAGVRDTLAGLDLLKRSLAMDGSLSGARDFTSALDGMASGVDRISSRFSAMGAIAFTVLQNLTTKAMDFVSRTAGRIIEPLVGGGRRRAENIEQAKFQFRGLGMDIDATMASALAAVQGTAFGLDEAARAAGQFGASGMEAGDDMTTALRAISGVAAMTNSSYSDTADIFTKVAGNGRVMGDDLLRMSSRGLNAAATLADSMGISEAAVREMVTAGEVDFETFYRAMDNAFGENATKANETYAGSLANLRAAFSRIGANFFTPWLEQQRDLFNALSPAVDAVGEALKPVISRLTGFTGAKTKGVIDFINALDFSNLGQVFMPITNIVRNVFNAIRSVIDPIRDAFRQVFPPASIMQIAGILTAIEKFTFTLKMGGETSDQFRRTMAGLFAILGIGWEIVKAGVKFFFNLFGVVFDGSMGFLEITARVGDFLVALHQAIREGNGLTNFFSGLVTVLKVPIEMLKNFARAIIGAFDFKPPSSGALTTAFEPLGRLGHFLLNIWSNVVDLLSRGARAFMDFAQRVFEALGPVGTYFQDMFSGLSFEEILDTVRTGFFGAFLILFRRFVENLGQSVGSVTHNVTEPFRKLTFALNTMQNTLRAMTLMSIAIAVGVLTASVVALSKIDAAGLTKALTAISIMFTQLMAALLGFQLIGGVKGLVGVGTGLILLAVAVRILTSSVKALAELQWQDLAKGLLGVTVLLGALTVAVQLMSGHTAGMIRAGAGLLVLAVGIRILASAVTSLSGLSWEEMARGLVAVGGLLAALAIFTRLVAVNKAGLVQGAGLMLLAVGIRVLASAVSVFAQIEWGGIAKGLVSISAILTAFAIFSQTVGQPAKLMASGAALILIAAAMNILATAVGRFANMPWEELARGLLGMAGALLAIVVAMNLLPPNMMASAAGLVAVSIALGLIANAVQQMGGMSWGEIARGLTALAGSLIILSVGMLAMSAALPGAAATLVAAAALRALTPVLLVLGGMSIGEIAKALGVLAATFAVLGVSGMLLAPVAPILLVLGAGIALIGVGAALAGAGLVAMAAGLTALAAAGAAGIAAMTAFVGAILGMVPQIARAFGQMIVEVVRVIGNSAAAIGRAFTQILQAIIRVIAANAPSIIRLIVKLTLDMLRALTTIIPAMARAALQIMLGVLRALSSNVPQIVRVITTLVVRLLNELARGVPRFVRAAVNLMVAFLRSLQGQIGRVVRAGTDVIIALIRGISSNMNRIVDEGAKAVISFINGVARTIRNRSAELRAAGKNLAGAIISGMTGGLTDGVAKVARKARELASSAISAAGKIFRRSSPSKVFIEMGHDVGEGLAIGIEDMTGRVAGSTTEVGKGAIRAMKESMAALSAEMDLDTDLHPTVTPVLDLTQFEKDAGLISTTLSGQQIQVDSNYAKAKDASTRYLANVAALREIQAPVEEVEQSPVQYVQNNYSPKALSSAEIYRQTKNQLSVTKGALVL